MVRKMFKILNYEKKEKMAHCHVTSINTSCKELEFNGIWTIGASNNYVYV